MPNARSMGSQTPRLDKVSAYYDALPPHRGWLNIYVEPLSLLQNPKALPLASEAVRRGGEGNIRMAKGQSSSRRSDILRAAEKLMATKGLNAVTTRQISREVGCSEGALYVHFKGRLELLLAMLEECLPDARQSLDKLEGSPGRSSPQENLVMALTGLYRFHQRV